MKIKVSILLNTEAYGFESLVKTIRALSRVVQINAITEEVHQYVVETEYAQTIKLNLDENPDIVMGVNYESVA